MGVNKLTCPKCVSQRNWYNNVARSYTIQQKAAAVTEERVEKFLCLSGVGFYL